MDVTAGLDLAWQDLGGGRDGLWVAVCSKSVLKVGMMNVRPIAEGAVTFKWKMVLFFNSLLFSCCLWGRDTYAPGWRLRDTTLDTTLSAGGPSADGGDDVALLQLHGLLAG